MTNEEAKKRLEVRMICANCPEDKMCYDSHLHSICEYTDYCDEVPIEEAVKVAIKALEQNEVLGKIKEEIEQEYNRLSATRADETLELGECLGLKMSLKIIGKYSRRE